MIRMARQITTHPGHLYKSVGTSWHTPAHETLLRPTSLVYRVAFTFAKKHGHKPKKDHWSTVKPKTEED